MSKALPKGGSALCYVQGYERPASEPGCSKTVGAGSMAIGPRSQFASAMTGNAGLNYAGWQLSRRGWHVMPTIRNARGSDLMVTNHDETVFFGVQSKALSKRNPIRLGLSLEDVRSDYWVITVKANSDAPICYVLSRDDIRRVASRDKGGQQAFWLEMRDFEKDEFREAWDRMLPALPTSEPASQPKATAMPETNGVRRPKPDTLCGKAWAIFDKVTKTSGSWASVGEALELAKIQGLNVGNVRAEYARWRKFHGITGRIARPK